jgi:hypothetical protein
VAVISAGAAIVGASVAQAGAIIGDGRKAKRDRQERLATQRRRACVQLLRTAGRLRVQVANNHEYHGDDMGTRLARVRELAAAAAVEAVNIALMDRSGLAGPAQRLARAAERLADATVASTNLDMGVCTRVPDFSELDECADGFRSAAVPDDGG